MRISRDLVRPLVALVVILATLSTVSTVAAFRSATTDHASPTVTCPQADAAHQDAAAQCSDRSTATKRRAADGDGDSDRRSSGDDDGARSRSGSAGRTGQHVVIVTRSGAS
ncbi:MAG: hypothetical protein ABEJ31_14965 [Haloarculaceae archaeon]